MVEHEHKRSPRSCPQQPREQPQPDHRLRLTRLFLLCGSLPPGAVVEWIDHWEHAYAASVPTTTLCPFCGIDSVIAGATGCPVTGEFPTRMNRRWF